MRSVPSAFAMKRYVKKEGMIQLRAGSSLGAGEASFASPRSAETITVPRKSEGLKGKGAVLADLYARFSFWDQASSFWWNGLG